MYYNTIPNSFEYKDILNIINRNVPRGTCEFYLRAGMAPRLAPFLKFLNYYLLKKKIALYFTNTDAIKRSTDLRYYFQNLSNRTRDVNENDTDYSSPLAYTQEHLNNLNLILNALHIVSVEARIQDVFDYQISNWAHNVEAKEILGVSLALKITPKHRVRVYKRGQHIIVFTTKGILDTHENDYKFYRKLWACLPILCNLLDATGHTEYPDIVELCKSLDKDDATLFWTLLQQHYSECEDIKNLKYDSIIQAFNSIQSVKISILSNQIAAYQNDANRLMNDFARVLELKRDVERQLVEIQSKDLTISVDVIKRLVDKQICYQLETTGLTSSDGTLSYRCSAPLLSYDKDAALTLYNKRVVPDYTANTAKMFKLLFIDEKVVLNFDEAIDIKTNRGTIQAKTGYTRFYNDLNSCFPNPHHHFFNCWGSYQPTIIKLIHELKLEELFYQVKAAIGSLNFLDYPVMNQFLQILNAIADGDYNPACFYWRDEGCTQLHTFDETLNHFIFMKEDAE